jgi:hypothetical protein
MFSTFYWICNIIYDCSTQGELIITCEDDEHSSRVTPESALSGRTTGRVVNKKNGVTSVEYAVTWKSAAEL